MSSSYTLETPILIHNPTPPDSPKVNAKHETLIEEILEAENIINEMERLSSEVVAVVAPQYNPVMRIIIRITKSIEGIINNIFGIQKKPETPASTPIASST